MTTLGSQFSPSTTVSGDCPQVVWLAQQSHLSSVSSHFSPCEWMNIGLLCLYFSGAPLCMFHVLILLFMSIRSVLTMQLYF